jgi:uracil-DNA glycosylase
METLLCQIRACTVCAAHLPFAPRPVFQVSPKARIMIIGQAPGLKVQQSGIPWDDQSGQTLRRWLGVTPAQFYDPTLFAIVPMGFCFPGTGASGDLPPRPECAPLWHGPIREQLTEIKLTLLIGQYAQRYYLPTRTGKNLTEAVQAFETFLPGYWPLVHPSPRNKIWHKKNGWFEAQVVPRLQAVVSELVS